MALSLFLFIVVWPFSHKKPAAPPDAPKFINGECTQQDGLYWYVADDGAFAFSSASCDAAVSNLDTARILNQWKMSRI